MDSQRRVLALIFLLFLFLLYKQTVLDRYLAPPDAGQQTAAVQPKPAAESKSSSGLSSPEQFSEPIAPPVASTGQASESATPKARPYPTDLKIRGEGQITVSGNDLTVTLSLLGGRVTEALLNHHLAENNPESPPVNLVEHVEYAPFPLGIYSGGVDDSNVRYQLVSGNRGSRIELSEGAEEVLELEGVLPDGRTIRKIIKFYGSGYFVDVQVRLSAPSEDASRLEIEWTKLIEADSPSLLDPYNVAGFTWFEGKKAVRRGFNEMVEDEIEREEFGNVEWLALSDKYFAVAKISLAGEAGARGIRTGGLYRSRLSGGDATGDFRVFIGPKSYRMLSALGYELNRLIDFGMSGFMSAPLLAVLHFLYNIIGNYGVAIVALTILVRMCLFPLSKSAFTQMKSMQEIQPEMKRIRESVKDKQQQQVQLMELYKKRGVNPLGGCLPMFLQMPVFLGLFAGLQLAIELRHSPFAFWINDLSMREEFMIGGIRVPLVVVLLVVLMMVQQLTTPSTMEPAQKKMMLVMPLVMGFFFSNFPAGLTLYWLTNTSISIAEQRTLRSHGAKEAFLMAIAVGVGVLILAAVLAAVG